uniref:Uncharacterized protein n=1 Tax=Aegilops tauschii subsp. strangulata TaxID=200361 RepID=A0A453RQ97_AEGTS
MQFMFHIFVGKWHFNNFSPKVFLFLYTILLHTSYDLLFLNINHEHSYICLCLSYISPIYTFPVTGFPATMCVV